MNWNPEQLLEDFLTVAELAGIKLQREAIRIETLRMPHKPPSSTASGRRSKPRRMWKCSFSTRYTPACPTPPFTVDEKKAVAAEVYAHVWQQAISGVFARVA